jgi:hypothetical protein
MHNIPMAFPNPTNETTISHRPNGKTAPTAYLGHRLDDINGRFPDLRIIAKHSTFPEHLRSSGLFENLLPAYSCEDSCGIVSVLKKRTTFPFPLLRHR